MKSKENLTDFFKESEKILPKSVIKEAQNNAQKEILKIKLSDLRKQFGIKQSEIKGFSQTSVSRLESRKDMKISTLMDYIHSLGLEIEIKVKEKRKGSRKEITLIQG